eukprot:snap_masked-scaffold2556_size14514-processed-gene-0.1 protein:Tk11378 transcript:snap_masked-scaffold2556_size14514-processed-gene-0.1-mRNA-1 annotation:"fumarate hydratase"
MGEVKVPADALYQAQTQRAADNFAFSSHKMPTNFIQALALIKQAAADTNAQLGLLEGDIANAIAEASQEIIEEAAAMAAAQVIGNDTTITVAGQSGNFQLNVMLPRLLCLSEHRDVSKAHYEATTWHRVPLHFNHSTIRSNTRRGMSSTLLKVINTTSNMIFWVTRATQTLFSIMTNDVSNRSAYLNQPSREFKQF